MVVSGPMWWYMKIEVYTDGSATIASKPGGFGYVVVIDGEKKYEGSGFMEKASNNDAEMEAAIQGLASVLKMVNDHPKDFPVDTEVYLVSDSQLILGWVNGSYKFKQRHKRNKFDQLQYVSKKLRVKTQWVQGHSGNEHNERCDKLANMARLNITKRQEGAKSLIGPRKSGTVCFWYKDKLKVVDLEQNLIEDYDRALHGSRGSLLEIKQEKHR